MTNFIRVFSLSPLFNHFMHFKMTNPATLSDLKNWKKIICCILIYSFRMIWSFRFFGESDSHLPAGCHHVYADRIKINCSQLSIGLICCFSINIKRYFSIWFSESPYVPILGWEDAFISSALPCSEYCGKSYIKYQITQTYFSFVERKEDCQVMAPFLPDSKMLGKNTCCQVIS